MKLEIAKSLISKGCVKFSPENPFEYASGLKGPIYCDNRLILSHVNFRNQIIESFLKVIKGQQLKYDLIGGIATAGIPHAAFLADRLEAPMVYIRPKAKDHGKKNQVEGDYQVNQSVLLVEDLINQGASLAETMTGIHLAGLRSQDCLCIVDYQMKTAQKRAKELSLTLHSLTDFQFLLTAALELNFISLEGKKLLIQWQDDPKEWSKQF